MKIILPILSLLFPVLLSSWTPPVAQQTNAPELVGTKWTIDEVKSSSSSTNEEETSALGEIFGTIQFLLEGQTIVFQDDGIVKMINGNGDELEIGHFDYNPDNQTLKWWQGKKKNEESLQVYTAKRRADNNLLLKSEDNTRDSIVLRPPY